MKQTLNLKVFKSLKPISLLEKHYLENTVEESHRRILDEMASVYFHCVGTLFHDFNKHLKHLLNYRRNFYLLVNI